VGPGRPGSPLPKYNDDDDDETTGWPKKRKVKAVFLEGSPPQSYGASLGSHTMSMLPATL